jgi:hypothetical protein
MYVLSQGPFQLQFCHKLARNKNFKLTWNFDPHLSQASLKHSKSKQAGTASKKREGTRAP